MEKLILLLGSFGFGAVIGGLVIYFFIKSFIPSYLAEKAKNLASKEDIEFIADKVESVKSDYARLLEEVRSNYQLRSAAIEREKRIKKEVYMDAVEAITRSQNMISAFCNLNLSEEQITSGLVNDAGRIAKIQVVGEKETVRAVTKFMAEVGRRSLDLMLKRKQLVQRKNTIQIYESFRDKNQEEIDKYIAMIKNKNIQGEADNKLWDSVSQHIKFEQEQYDKHQKDLDALWAIQSQEHLKFTKECMDTFFEISSLLPATVLAVRKELDLDISSEDYLNIFNENIQIGKKVFDDFLQRVSS